MCQKVLFANRAEMEKMINWQKVKLNVRSQTRAPQLRPSVPSMSSHIGRTDPGARLASRGWPLADSTEVLLVRRRNVITRG